MFPYTFEAVTALTISVISVILILYVIVLKRKGWLKEEHARAHCPRCGFDLKSASPSRTSQKTEMAVEIPPSPEKPRITIGDPLSTVKQDRLEEFGVQVKTSETATSVELRERPKTPAVATEIPKPLEEPAEDVEAPEISRDKRPPTTPIEGREASPPGCPHFLGYLKKIPKDAPILDECLTCPRILECLAR